ncbi:MAG: hypothetical protein ABSB78_04050 [Bacteroidota bacterium]
MCTTSDFFRHWIFGGLLCILFCSVSYAQIDTAQVNSGRSSDSLQSATISAAQTSDSLSLLEKIVAFSGEIGMYGELYHASGIDDRRPSATGRLYFQPTISLFKTLTMNFNLLLSTEGSSARQSLDQIAIHPEWSWGRADIGDFSSSLSDFTLNGVTIRGGGVEINPGIFRFAAIGGLTHRAVEGNAVDAAFERVIAAGRIGIGREGGDFFDITVLRARDNSSSLKVPEKPDSIPHKDSTSVIDSLYATTQNDPFLTVPQENLVAGISTGFSLFDGVFTFRGEAAGCMFTSDMNAAEISDTSALKNKTVSSLKNLYTLRMSTSADYALKTSVVLDFQIFSLRGGFTRIGASYTSLGLASQINDRKGFDLGFTTQLLEGGISLNATYDQLSDNLAEQKRFTTQRSTLSVNLGVRPTNWMFTMLGYVANGLLNDASNDTMKIENTMASYMANLSFLIPIGTVANTLTLTGSFQTSDDGNIFRKDFSSQATTMMVNISSVLTEDLSVNPFGGVTSTQISGEKDDITTLGITINYRMFEGKLNNSFTLSDANSAQSKTLSVTLQSSYPVWNSDTVNLNVRYSDVTGSGAGANFNETQAALSYSHRF